jgi:uncharacterized 2Fe-2S/4Fe-4S cluster protein (DUF4445 family)
MQTREAIVVFQPSGRHGHVPLGITILEAARRIGADIEGLCGERQVCGKCKVRIETGVSEPLAVASAPRHAGPWHPVEDERIDAGEKAAGMRLACVATVQGDLLVHVPEASRAGRPVAGKAARPMAINCDPAVRSYPVTVSEATLADPAADWERLGRALAAVHGLNGLSVDLYALRALPAAVRGAAGQVTVTVWQGREVVGIRAGTVAAAFGLAVDLGTTTVAGYLCDLATAEVVATAAILNPQVTFGEDVLSRIAYANSHPDGLQRINRALVDGLNRLIAQVAAAAGAARGAAVTPEDIDDLALCGNTAMQHILLQTDPRALGEIPFTPVNHRSLDIKARDLGLRINPSAYLFVLPAPAAFVGGDNVGVVLAEAPHKKDRLQLIIDIGTNGEIVLGNREKLISTSCATGPALEGAQIQDGMRAAPGAIERVRIDPAGGTVDYKVVGRDAWRSGSRPADMQVRGICGSGVIDAVAELYRSGIVTKSGAFASPPRSERQRATARTGMQEFVLAWAGETGIGRDVVITQKDIRQIQLAKAAVYTGCKFLLRRFKVERPDEIKIAGAFGAHLDRTLALVLGLFPDCPVDCVDVVGNAAGDGCRAALLDRKKREEADRIARQVEYVELTLEPDFQRELIAATQIPHMTDAFPHLDGIVPGKILYR